ncbi:hypothetical protein [Nostoc sp.]|uniref:hypothetical protein n=1 Tax=Nostoc sp. TaxID=1180 RepID=UPI002FFAECC6
MPLFNLEPVSLFLPQFIQLLDKKDSGVNGGFAAIADWTNKTVNFIAVDETDSVSLINNVFILPLGDYQISITTDFYGLYDTKIRLFNLTDGITLLQGINGQFNPNSGMVGHSHLTGKFTVLSDKSLLLQYYTVAGNSNQYNHGGSVGDGSPEIYTSIDLWKVG